MNLVNENEQADREWANKHAAQLDNLFVRFKNRGGALMQDYYNPIKEIQN